MLVILGGGLGAAARYLLTLALIHPRFPYATVGINLAGSLLLGVLLGASTHRDVPSVLVTTLGTGVLGGFTTFSTFSVEAADLFRGGRPLAAAAYLLITTAGGVLAAVLGYAAAASR